MSGTTGAVPISGQRLHWGAALTEEKSSQVSGTFTNCVPPSDETITWRAVVPPFGRIVAAAECRIPCTVAPCVKCFHSEEGATFPRRAPRVTGCSGLRCAGGGGCAGRRPVGGLRRAVPASAPPGSRPRRSRGSGPGRAVDGRERTGTHRRRAGPAGGAAGGRATGRRAVAARERFLAAQLGALEWRARGLAGQRVPFRREVRECLGLSATRGEPDAYRAAHRELAALLGGRGTVGERLTAHRRRDAVPRERLGLAVRALSTALRAGWLAVRAPRPRPSRTGSSTTPRGARCTRTPAVTVGRAGQRGRGARRGPAAAAGGARGLPRPPRRMQPGEAAVAAGRVEPGVTLLGSPQTVVSEGLAECALGTAVGPRWGRWASDVLAQVGVPLDGELASGSTPSWRCCGGCASTRPCCCTTTGRPRAGGSRPPRRTCGAGCCSMRNAPDASSTLSRARCGGRTSSPPSRARRSSDVAGPRPEPGRSTVGCSTTRPRRMRCAAERVRSVGHGRRAVAEQRRAVDRSVNSARLLR